MCTPQTKKLVNVLLIVLPIFKTMFSHHCIFPKCWLSFICTLVKSITKSCRYAWCMHWISKMQVRYVSKIIVLKGLCLFRQTFFPHSSSRDRACRLVCNSFEDQAPLIKSMGTRSLQWRHNEHNVVSNHRRLHRLLCRLFRCRSEKSSKFRITGLCEWNSPVTSGFPSQRDSKAGNLIHLMTLSCNHEAETVLMLEKWRI